MSSSVFETIKDYFVSIGSGAHSLWKTVAAVLPYQFGVGVLRREVTEQYPDRVSSKTQEDLPAKFRGTLFNDIEKCNASRTCESVCPVKCISIDVNELEEFKKKWINDFSIDLSRCIYCGICVEKCPSGSLVHTKEYESSSREKDGLVLRYGKGLVSALDKEKLKARERL